LARAKEIRVKLLMIFGTKDPHVPHAERETIESRAANLRCPHKTLLSPAEHAFTPDEGPRFDPEATDLRLQSGSLFRNVFIENSSSRSTAI